MVSTQGKIERCAGLLETRDLDDWEHEFIESMVKALNRGLVNELSDKQLFHLDRIFNTHFSG